MIELEPMTQDEFQIYLDRAVPEYAQEKVRSGNWDASIAVKKAKEEYEKLLPDGLSSPDHYLFTVQNSETGDRVGMVWFSVMNQRQQPIAFIFDLYIEPAHRRKGYGRQTMLAIEEKVKALHIHQIGLHVFAHNHEARALYQRLGFVETNINMKKELS